MDIHHHGKKVEVPMSHEELSNFPIPAEERNRHMVLTDEQERLAAIGRRGAESVAEDMRDPLMAQNLRLKAENYRLIEQVRALREAFDRNAKYDREDKRPKWILSVPRFGIGRLVVWLFRLYLNRQMWELKVRGRAPITKGARRQHPYSLPLNLSSRVAVYILPKRKRG